MYFAITAHTCMMKKKWQQMLGNEPEPEEDGILSGMQSEFNECCGQYCKLSRKQRLYGFAICFAMGFIFSIIGTALVALSLKAFAVCYSLGTVTSLASTMFLFGPWYQIKNMFKETRWIASLVMLVSIAMTLVSAIVWDSVGLAILFAIIQFVAVFWYSISYIPFARSAVKGCARSCMGGGE
eukprot:m.359094 g.359094  ORF g.359094 m.359094 type:complete len:182 (+) comp18405_c0_seq1:227-772(+)